MLLRTVRMLNNKSDFYIENVLRCTANIHSSYENKPPCILCKSSLEKNLVSKGSPSIKEIYLQKNPISKKTLFSKKAHLQTKPISKKKTMIISKRSPSPNKAHLQKENYDNLQKKPISKQSPSPKETYLQKNLSSKETHASKGIKKKRSPWVCFGGFTVCCSYYVFFTCEKFWNKRYIRFFQFLLKISRNKVLTLIIFYNSMQCLL